MEAELISSGVCTDHLFQTFEADCIETKQMGNPATHAPDFWRF
jgi:hypothetical protein